MKPTYLLAAIILSLATFAAPTAQGADTYFRYPQIPDSIEGLKARSDYYLTHFWDGCNMKSAFSSLGKMQNAFHDYVSLMPYASDSVVTASIDALIASVKKNPQNLLSLAEMAEGTFYADTARLECDHCYLKFAGAVADHKKISRAEKARFEYQYNTLSGTQPGMVTPDFTYTDLEGNTHRFSDIPAGAYVLLFFNDPDCEECQMARIRLTADIAVNDLIDSGRLLVVSIYPGEPTDEWRLAAQGYNPKWIVGASPEIDDHYDLRQTPAVYYLSDTHEILSKNLPVENLIEGFRTVTQRSKR